MKKSLKIQPSTFRKASGPRLRRNHGLRAVSPLIVGGSAIAFLGICIFVRAAQPTTNEPVSSRNELSSFKLITDRNIFNTRRYANSVRANDRNRDAGRSRTRGESFALVGTMRYDKGPFAFFDGTRSDYRKVLKPDETIAGFKVAEILPASVRLTSSTNEVELHVGMQLRREDDNSEWVKSERPESAEPSGGVSSYSHLSFKATEPVAAPSSNSDFQGGPPDGGPFPFNPDGAQAFLNGDQPQATPSFNATNAPLPNTEGITDPVVLRMMQRRAQERGD